MEDLGGRVVVAAFDGWNDAGEAASEAVAVLKRSTTYERVFAVDPEMYFDYQYTRPQLTTDAAGRHRLEWPESALYRPAEPERRPWLLSGVEPARAWQAFTAEFVDVLLREGVTGVVTLGSMLSDVPHTRPITVTATSDDEEVRVGLGLERGDYEGPVGILSALTDAAGAAGIATAALWASVPHYVAGRTPSPKATLALLERLEPLVGSPLPRADLAAEAARWEASIDAAAADDDDMAEYIRKLERARDAWDSPDASGEALAQEFQRYLHRRHDGPGEPGRHR